MILQALVGHYEDLIARGDIAPPGWAPARISFALRINDAGELTQAMPLKTEQTSGKKTALLPQEMILPAAVKRTVGISANFLWDNSGYLLGADDKGKPQRSKECFAAAKAFHSRLLTGVDTPAARAIIAFFRSWDPEQARNHPALKEHWDELMKGNMVFCYGDTYVHEDPAVRQAWQTYYDGTEEGDTAVCLVTGELSVPQTIHPAVKGVQGAQSSGAALVSFNASAFCSYGKEQSLNAPVGKYAAFAYTAALNHLLADREHVTRVGDATVVCWAEGGDPAYRDFACGYFFGEAAPKYTQEELQGMAKTLLSGKPVDFDESRLDPNRPFYILGLSPNAARLSVRFFLRNSFGSFVANVQKHYERMNIVRPAYEKFDTIPPLKLLGETVNQKARDKSPSPGLSGEVLRAILEDKPYPATLLNGTELRIRAEQRDKDHPDKPFKVTWGRAAILKAYYTKQAEFTHRENPDIPKEVLQVSLNTESTNIPYTLGRLFSVLEYIQEKANPGINATIKDKFFNSASATPGRVIPNLVNLAQKHLRKLPAGQKISLDKQLTEILAILGETYPDRLTLPQQGSFQLGYYHQTQARYQKKEEKENV